MSHNFPFFVALEYVCRYIMSHNVPLLKDDSAIVSLSKVNIYARI